MTIIVAMTLMHCCGSLEGVHKQLYCMMHSSPAPLSHDKSHAMSLKGIGTAVSAKPPKYHTRPFSSLEGGVRMCKEERWEGDHL